MSQRNAMKGRADAFYEPPMSFLTPSTLSDVPRCGELISVIISRSRDSSSDSFYMDN